MSIIEHRTVEHTYDSGDQSILKIKTIHYDQSIGGVGASLMISDENDDQSISIKSPDQLKRLIDNLKAVAETVLMDNADGWNQ